MDEKRQYPRYDSRFSVTFTTETGAPLRLISKIVNVSRGGMQLTSHSPLPVNTVLHMKIGGTHDQGPLSLAGKVVWVNPAPAAEELYYSGVSFADIGEDARAVILSALT